MFARIITNVAIMIGGGIGGMAISVHPKPNWGEFTIGAADAFFGMIFRGLAERTVA